MRAIVLSLLLVGAIIPGISFKTFSSSSESREDGIQGSIIYRIEGGPLKTAEMSSSPLAQQIASTMLNILKDANSTYKYMITAKILHSLRKSDYVEVVFNKGKPVKLIPLGFQEHQIKRIIIGLGGKNGWRNDGVCEILFGDPDIDEFNIVLNSNPKISRAQFLQWLQELDAQSQ